MLDRETHIFPVIMSIQRFLAYFIWYFQKFLAIVIPVVRYAQKHLAYVMPVIKYVALSKKSYYSYKVCLDANGVCYACHKVC